MAVQECDTGNLVPDKISVYKLLDPREPEAVRYVGITKNGIEHRLRRHLSQATRSTRGLTSGHKFTWIRSLLSAGVVPIVQLIEIVSPLEWQDRERYWISKFKAEGHRLTNATDGGEGTMGHVPTEQQRLNMSISGRKRPPISDATKELIRASKIGKPRSAAIRAALAAFNKGRSFSVDHRAKISAGNLGKKQPPEAIEKTRAANLGKKRHPEAIEKTRAAHLGRKRSEDACRRMSDAQLRRYAAARYGEPG